MEKILPDIIAYAIEHTNATRKSKKVITDAINNITYAVMCGNHYIVNFSAKDPFAAVPMVDKDTLQKVLKDLYLDVKDIEWDIEFKETEKIERPNNDSNISKRCKPEKNIDTPKENLYLKAPIYPRFDTSKYIFMENIGSETFYMHPSLPIIPEKQNDISVTTDVNKMTEKDLLNLYPNRIIRTRADVMYEPLDGVTMDKDLGLLIPIEGYTDEQVRDNIIRYPHFFQLTRIFANLQTLEDKEVNFYKHIEIDGKLYDVLEVWDSLHISKILPKTVEFIKEYVIRKYILDRDNGVEHKYPMHGSLMPFLTIFAPADFYKSYGNPVELMRKCVSARVDFFKSRNPYIAKYNMVKQGKLSPYETTDCPFKQYCKKIRCSNICADFSEIEYLMERNKLLNNKDIFMKSNRDFQNASEWLTAASNTYKVVISDNTLDTASCLTYAAICHHWKGNTFHCSVYHLDYASYLDKQQQSWGKKDDEDMEYTQIFISKAQVLIVSNIDYVQFKDFQAQQLLNIIHGRKVNGLSSIVVSPKLSSLIGSGQFFQKLKDVLGKEVLDK
jgi:hypothetical protein